MMIPEQIPAGDAVHCKEYRLKPIQKMSAPEIVFSSALDAPVHSIDRGRRHGP